jgi:solute carrier family 25 iron transporter 28/37
MEDEYDYESLGANSTMAQNAIAGAMAGIGEHCIMYPVDSIRVRETSICVLSKKV